jgi:hypothetical protein
MLYTLILVSAPTAVTVIIVSVAMNDSNLITLLVFNCVLYVLVVAFLFLAGLTDPGIFERKPEYVVNKDVYIV